MSVNFSSLKTACAEAFAKAGMGEKESLICADVLATADAMGLHSHGTVNAYNYIEKAKAGGVNFNALPKNVLDLPSMAQIDANNSLGFVSSTYAMELACEKAKATGIAFVSVKNSSHFGAAGYYVNIAAKQGLFGFVASNVDPNMAVPGSRGKAIGNNPIAFAAPALSIPSVFLDISTSATASLKVLQAKEDGLKVPDGWIIDKNGLPTNDPSHFPQEGALQPVGQHKGYGLAVLVECLTGILTGCGTSASGLIPSWCFALDESNNVSHCFMAIDVQQLCPDKQYREQVEEFISSIHDIPVVEGHDRIYAPGERSWARYRLSAAKGVELPAATLESLQKLGISFC